MVAGWPDGIVVGGQYLIIHRYVATLRTKWFSRHMATALGVAPSCHSERSEAGV
jgi:hypothetical protein